MAGKVLDSFHIASDEFIASLALDGLPAPVKARYAAPHSFDEEYRWLRVLTLVTGCDVYLAFFAPVVSLGKLFGAEVDQDVGINFVAAAWAGIQTLLEEFEWGVAVGAGQFCVALFHSSVIDPANHTDVVRTLWMGLANNCGRPVAMTAWNDFFAFRLLVFDLRLQDLKSSFDELTLAHHALVEHL